MKSVLMLYPINAFVRGDSEFPKIPHMYLDSLERFWTRALPDLKFKERFRLIIDN